MARPKAGWAGYICHIHQQYTTASDCQTTNGQIPGDEPDQGIDGCGRKCFIQTSKIAFCETEQINALAELHEQNRYTQRRPEDHSH